MSNFKIKKIGTYTYGFTKTGKPMQRLMFNKDELSKVKEWDLEKIYIYEPSKTGGDIFGLIDEPNN